MHKGGAVSQAARVGIGEPELLSKCCRAKVTLFGGALVEPRPEDVVRVRDKGEPPPAYMTGGVHWCSRCGTPWLMRALVSAARLPLPAELVDLRHRRERLDR